MPGRTRGRTLAAALWVLSAGLAGAADWVAMTGPEIAAALSGRELRYDNGAWQRFNPSGRTRYNAGSDSWGYWAVRGDRYCSQWPPGEQWACYDMARQGERFRFIDDNGAVSDGARVAVK